MGLCYVPAAGWKNPTHHGLTSLVRGGVNIQILWAELSHTDGEKYRQQRDQEKSNVN